MISRSILVLLLATAFQTSYAHDHGDHHSLPSSAPISGASLYQIDSTWKDQAGKTVNFKDLAGTPRLVALLYTRCQTACPLIVDDIQSVLTSLSKKEREKLKVAIFSIDSEGETPESLKKFADKRKLGHNWRLFTGNSSDVATLAAALGFKYKKLANNEFVHSNIIYFIDAKGEVAAYKEGLKTPKQEFLKKIKTAL